GIALLTAILLMMLVSALLVGFTAVVMSDQRFRGSDRTRTAAFYAAHAGLEKLTADLGNLFNSNYAPKAKDVNDLTKVTPVFADTSFTAADGTSGYKILFPTNAQGNPLASSRNIASGPYQGLVGLITPYTIDVTARTVGGGEVHLQRSFQTV